MKKVSSDLPAAKMYMDDREANSVNEVAINWNAPLVFLLAGVGEGAGNEVPAAAKRK